MMNGNSYGFLRRPSTQMVRIIFSIPYRLFIEPQKIEWVIRSIYNGNKQTIIPKDVRKEKKLKIELGSIKTDP